MAILQGCGQGNDSGPAKRIPITEDVAKPVEKPLPVITNSIGMKLALVPPGEFLMGSSNEDEFADDDEKPQHQVRITQSFYLGVYEVTQREWIDVTKRRGIPWRNMNPRIGARAFGPTKEGGRYPAAPMSKQLALEFCDLLTKREMESGALPSGWKYTLPTEAQWEYACRAGTTTRFSFGDDPSSLNGYAWCNTFDDGHPREVGLKRPNPWGLYDMHGNVKECCLDRYAENYYAGSPVEDPSGPADGKVCVYRGGAAFFSDARDCRSTSRSRGSPSVAVFDIGFRVARVRIPE